MKNHLRMNQTQGTENSGTGAAPAQTQTPAAQTQAQGQADNSIEAMYGEAQAQASAQPAATQGQPAAQTAAGTEKPASGYQAPPAGTGSGYVPPAAADDKSKEQTAAATQTTESEVKFDESGLTPEAIKEIKDFATANKLSKEATEQYAKVIKGQAGLVENFKKEQEKLIDQARLKQRNEWYNQLKTDKEFGGELFDTNLKRIDTILEKFMPNTKNMLTSRGAMLPPDVMKDLHGLYKVLLGNDDTFVSGNATGVSGLNEDEKFLQEYYK